MSTIAIIQARLGSTRLPNKVLMQIPPESGVSMLEMVVRKVLLASMVDDVAVVTPDLKIGKLCEVWNVAYFVTANKERDVLKEYYDAATELFIEIDQLGDPLPFNKIVRITADTPLVCSALIDKCVKTFLEKDVDYVYNSEGKFNDGCDTEVFSYDALKQAFHKAKGEEREHVGLWMRRNLRTYFCKEQPNYEVESVDTYADYLRVCEILCHIKTR